MRLWKRAVAYTRCKAAGHCVFVLLHAHGRVCGVGCMCFACRPPRRRFA